MADASTRDTLSIPVNAWTVAAIITALFLIKATGDNPYEYYVNLRWITLVVAVVGAYATFHFEQLGWTLLFFGLAVVYNPVLPPFRLDRSTWILLDWVTAVVLVAGAFLVRWDIQAPRLVRARDVIDRLLLFSVGIVWGGVIVHVAIVLALLPFSYIASGDEEPVDAWIRFRDAHPWVIGSATVGAVGLYYSYAFRRARADQSPAS